MCDCDELSTGTSNFFFPNHSQEIFLKMMMPFFFLIIFNTWSKTIVYLLLDLGK